MDPFTSLVAAHEQRAGPGGDGREGAGTPPVVAARITAASVKAKLWNGCHNSGSDVIWFQSMKSGMPGVVWILVLTGSDASSFRNIAMQ